MAKAGCGRWHASGRFRSSPTTRMVAKRMQKIRVRMYCMAQNTSHISASRLRQLQMRAATHDLTDSSRPRTIGGRARRYDPAPGHTAAPSLRPSRALRPCDASACAVTDEVQRVRASDRNSVTSLGCADVRGANVNPVALVVTIFIPASAGGFDEGRCFGGARKQLVSLQLHGALSQSPMSHGCDRHGKQSACQRTWFVRRQSRVEGLVSRGEGHGGRQAPKSPARLSDVDGFGLIAA